MKKIDYFVLVFICVTASLFLILSGTINSGLQFIDNHEVYRSLNTIYIENSFWDGVLRVFLSEFETRYRPIYTIIRRFQEIVFKDNYQYWAYFLLTFLIGSLISYYALLKKMSFNYFEIVCFFIYVLIGEQIAIWWKIGVNEPFGVFFLAISIYFSLPFGSLFKQRTRNFLFAFFMILSAFSKESFLIITPFLILFRIINDYLYHDLKIKTIILRSSYLIIPIILIAISFVYIIFFMGTNKIQYAGVKIDSLSNFLNQVLNILKIQLRTPIIIIIVLNILLYFQIKSIRKYLNFLKSNSNLLILSFGIIISNLILYAKSGMSERYLFPTIIGLGFILIIIIKEIRINHSWLTPLVLAFIIIISFNNFKIANKSAKKYVLDAKNNELFF